MNEFEDEVDLDQSVYTVLNGDPSTDWHQGSMGVTTKVPPLFDGKTSWFQYEELIDDWVDLTTLDTAKHGPALKNRLTGEASVYKSLLNRDILRTARGVQHFKDILRPNFVKGPQSVFLWRFFQLVRSHRGSQDFVKWIGRFTVQRKRVHEAWMDLLPQYTNTSEAYLRDVATLNTTNTATQQPAVDARSEETFNHWKNEQSNRHKAKFPLGDNLYTLIFIVISDLSEAQRERLQSTLSLKSLRVEDYTFEPVRDAFVELFCAPRSSLDNPSLRASSQGQNPSSRVSGQGQRGQRSFCVLEDGILEGTTGYWVQDNETLEEGFIGEFEDIFWTWDDENSAWQTKPLQRRNLRRGPKKGKSKRKERLQPFQGKRSGTCRSGKPVRTLGFLPLRQWFATGQRIPQGLLEGEVRRQAIRSARR